ncbi:MAG: stearoyl-CoA desaturase (delta-9 desaturase) [Chlamydiales bacterium]|jgi:stearoyl-CoA desaturase (delta-9 desaturase)
MPSERILDKISARTPTAEAPQREVSASVRPQLPTTLRMPRSKIDWTNTLFIAVVHLIAIGSIYYMAAVHFDWRTVALGVVWFGLCGLGITGGYHRLFSHPTYKASWPLRAFYLFFGAASVQNSALKWSADHRLHHLKTDEPQDPYDITRGFWWAHIGWVFMKAPPELRVDLPAVKDLEADPLVRFQHKYYILVAAVSAGITPALIALAWGDPLGGLLVAGMLRLAVQWHATFSINSVAHMIGTQPYSTKNSARDSWITAILTLGEGYHNFHHRFQADYRNGVRWFQLDPTKWFVWSMSKIGVTSDLKRTPQKLIDRARETIADRAAPGTPN